VKLLVVNAYVRENGGDAALLSVLLSQLKQAYPQAELSIAGMEGPTDRPEFEGVPNIGSIRHYTSIESLSLPHRIMRKVLSLFVGEAWFVGPKGLWFALQPMLPREIRAEVAAIREADAVVALGGGYLNGKNNAGGDLNVYYLLLPARLAERLGKPVVFAPQSYGPFGNAKQERWARNVLNKTDFIMVREQTSMEILAKLGVKAELLHKTVDSGFAFTVPPKPDVLAQYGVKSDERVVGMTARNWLAPEAQAAYEKALAQTIDYIYKKYSMRVLLIPQVTSAFQADDDRIVEKRIAGYCDPESNPIVVDEMVDHKTLKAMYGSLDYLIGTRFHSVIFGLTSWVPAIAIEYEHKTGGIMHDLGLDEWVLKIASVTADDLNALIDKLVAGRESYLQHLQDKLPVYIEQANEAPSLIKRVLESRGAVSSQESQAQ
jgi:colanic acid/amylovoran biosynthesis protein